MNSHKTSIFPTVRYTTTHRCPCSDGGGILPLTDVHAALVEVYYHSQTSMQWWWRWLWQPEHTKRSSPSSSSFRQMGQTSSVSSMSLLSLSASAGDLSETPNSVRGVVGICAGVRVWGWVCMVGICEGVRVWGCEDGRVWHGRYVCRCEGVRDVCKCNWVGRKPFTRQGESIWCLSFLHCLSLLCLLLVFLFTQQHGWRPAPLVWTSPHRKVKPLFARLSWSSSQCDTSLELS